MEYTYDEDTKRRIDEVKLILSQYEKLLQEKLRKRGLTGYDLNRAYLNDEYRQLLLDRLTLIYSLAIPVSIKVDLNSKPY